MTPLVEAAPAKLNLALHVRGRAADGYHEIETIFAFTEGGDMLRGIAADGIGLEIEGPFGAALAGESNNLVLRAARLLAERAGIAAGAALTLAKNLPVASGLGGGSADAAATLRLLNRLWNLNWPKQELAKLGESLGADVPACVWSHTLFGMGRGDQFGTLMDGHLHQKPVLLVNPGVAVSTAAVFQGWDGVDRGPLQPELSLPALRAARNDLEASAIRAAPEIAMVLERLRVQPGAELVRMSGSGATCFALFESDAKRDTAAQAIAGERPDWWLMATRLK